jgi:hypothetical protein
MELKPGYKQTDVGMIPDEWGTTSLLAVADCLDNLRVPLNDAQRGRMQGDIPYCGANGVLDHVSDFIIDDDIILMAEDGGYFDEYASRPIAYRMQGKCWVNNHAHILKAKSGYDQGFLFYSLVHKNILPFLASGTRAKLNKSEMAKIVIPAPPTEAEQRAIAAALSDVDELLGMLGQLITKKRDLKQAAMQQLLAGQTRLPGFQGEWEEGFVGDVILGYFCGPSPTCEERNVADDAEWGVLKTTAVTNEAGWNWKAHKVLPRVFWNKPHLEVRKDDVIVTKAGPRHRVGVAAWVDFVPPRIIVSGKMIGLRPNPAKVVPLVLAAAISAPKAQVFLDQRTTGMAESQVNFENGALLQTPIRLPNIEEQTAIAKVLTEMDAELAVLQQRREKTRALKQAMMQELLTGRTRLLSPEPAHA